MLFCKALLPGLNGEWHALYISLGLYRECQNHFNALGPRLNGGQFLDGDFKDIFVKESI